MNTDLVMKMVSEYRLHDTLYLHGGEYLRYAIELKTEPMAQIAVFPHKTES